MGLFRQGYKAMFGRNKWKILRGDKVRRRGKGAGAGLAGLQWQPGPCAWHAPPRCRALCFLRLQLLATPMPPRLPPTLRLPRSWSWPARMRARWAPSPRSFGTSASRACWWRASTWCVHAWGGRPAASAARQPRLLVMLRAPCCRRRLPLHAADSVHQLLPATSSGTCVRSMAACCGARLLA